MLKVLLARLKQGHRTMAYPDKPPVLPDRFRGCPKLDISKCDNCRQCAEVCPTKAISAKKGLTLDLGLCIFCGECAKVCHNKAIAFSNDYRMAARKRDDMHLSEAELPLIQALEEKSRKLFGRSLKLREVSAGGCNACEADVNVLGTVVFDLGRFGIQVVASPRHADGLLITGPVPQNMHLALKKTYDAVPGPKLVIACGACAISGGIYSGHPESCDGADPILPVDLYIPGCPPHPITILDGLLRLLGRLESGKATPSSRGADVR